MKTEPSSKSSDSYSLIFFFFNSLFKGNYVEMHCNLGEKLYSARTKSTEDKMYLPLCKVE